MRSKIASPEDRPQLREKAIGVLTKDLNKRLKKREQEIATIEKRAAKLRAEFEAESRNVDDIAEATLTLLENGVTIDKQGAPTFDGPELGKRGSGTIWLGSYKE